MTSSVQLSRDQVAAMDDENRATWARTAATYGADFEALTGGAVPATLDAAGVGHVKVVGSLNLVQTLLREKLFDRLDLWVHPVVLGVGKKVFDGGGVPMNVTLLEPPVTGPKGVVFLRYGRAGGTPETGDMSAPNRGAGRDD